MFFLALVRAGLEMIEPLFMRFIIDHVLLERARSSTAERLTRLNLAGATFLAVIVVSNLMQRLQGLPPAAFSTCR